VAKPAVKVQGFVSSPSVDTVEYRDQLYQAVEAVVTSAVVGAIKGSVSIVGSTKKVSVSASLTPPQNAYTIPVPFALEAATSVDAQALRIELESIGVLPSPTPQLEDPIVVIIPDPIPITMTESVSVLTFAGGGGTTSNKADYIDGIGVAASFNHPLDLAVDSSRNIYVADTGNRRIRKISREGVVTTFAGSGEQGLLDGTGTSASFSYPTGIEVDANGNVYVADATAIRKITPQGVVTTLAGSGEYGDADGTGASAKFSCPTGIALDGSGNIYISDSNKIRMVTQQGVVTTVAGNGRPSFADGVGANAGFNEPAGIAVDNSGNIYVADRGNNRIRKINPQGVVTTLAGSGIASYSDGLGASASFYYPTGLDIGNDGYIYVTDNYNQKIRKVTTQGFVESISGSGSSGYADGDGKTAMFSDPAGVATYKGSVGNQVDFYIADSNNNRIRRVLISRVYSL
jgi:sugar lactone lactonase YvrE